MVALHKYYRMSEAPINDSNDPFTNNLIDGIRWPISQIAFHLYQPLGITDRGWERILRNRGPEKQ